MSATETAGLAKAARIDKQRVRAMRTWIETALDRMPFGERPETSADSFASTLLDSDDGPFERWMCTDEDCPARPTWDRALSDAYGELSDAITKEMERVVIEQSIVILTKLLQAYPDLPLKAEKVAAA